MSSRYVLLFIILIFTSPLFGQYNEYPHRFLSIQKFPKAIFYTYNDFINYTPDTALDFESGLKVMIKGGYYRKPPLEKLGNSDLSGIWGYSDNDVLYINLSNQFHPLTREQNDFFLYSYYHPAFKDINPDIAAAWALGGFIGMAIHADRHMRGEIFKFKLNFQDGKLTAMNTSDLRIYSEEIFFYFSSYSKPGEMSLFVDGIHLCAIEKGTFYYFQNKSYKSKREICLRSGFEEHCQTFSAPDAFRTLIYICNLKKGLPIMKQAAKELNSSMLHDIYQGRVYKESCE